jgi:dTDP-4-dehydrorhamnose reductase
MNTSSLNSSPKTILITGGSGFFGTNAAQTLRSEGYRVVCTSSEPHKYAAFGLHQQSLVEMNILHTSVLAVVEKVQPHLIIHAAAFSAPLACEQNPDHTFAVNVGGTQNILQAAQMLDVPVVFTSTDLVFNGDRDTAQSGFYTESDTPDARIVYGKSKIAAERVFQESASTKWTILRTSLMFGGRVEWANGFPQFAIDLLKTGKPATLFSDQYRTPAYIPDIAHVILRLVENSVESGKLGAKVSGKINMIRGKAGENGGKATSAFGEIYHCGGRERIDRVSFIERCCAVFGVETAQILAKRMDEVPSYTTRVHDVSLDSTKLCCAIEWTQTPLEMAFAEMKMSFSPMQ